MLVRVALEGVRVRGLDDGAEARDLRGAGSLEHTVGFQTCCSVLEIGTSPLGYIGDWRVLEGYEWRLGIILETCLIAAHSTTTQYRLHVDLPMQQTAASPSPVSWHVENRTAAAVIQQRTHEPQSPPEPGARPVALPRDERLVHFRSSTSACSRRKAHLFRALEAAAALTVRGALRGYPSFWS